MGPAVAQRLRGAIAEVGGVESGGLELRWQQRPAVEAAQDRVEPGLPAGQALGPLGQHRPLEHPALQRRQLLLGVRQRVQGSPLRA